MLKRCVLLLLCLPVFCLATIAQETDEPEKFDAEASARKWFGIEKGAAVRQKVEDLKLPILEAEFRSFTMCGADTYRIKDADGGYLIFTLHSFDTQRQLRPITIENPLGAKPDFEHELTPDGEEEQLLIKLLQGWRDTTFTAEHLRTFKRYNKLKTEAAIRRAWESFSEEETNLFSMSYLIRDLEERKNRPAPGTAAALKGQWHVVK